MIGLDPGAKVIGVALSDVTLMLAGPYGAIRRGRLSVNDAEITAIARKEDAGGVVGLPLSMDRTMGPAAQAAKDWARSLSDATGIDVAPFDERLSSAAMNRMLVREPDLTRARRAVAVDRAAAAYMLHAAGGAGRDGGRAMRLRNEVACFAWGLVGVWWTGLRVATWLVLRNGPPGGLSAAWSALLLGFFWLGGIGVARWAWRKPRIAAAVQPGGTVLVTQAFPLRRDRLRLAAADIAAVTVEETTDSDGDPYFRARLFLRDGRRFAAQEGHRRALCRGGRAGAAAGALAESRSRSVNSRHALSLPTPPRCRRPGAALHRRAAGPR